MKNQRLRGSIMLSVAILLLAASLSVFSYQVFKSAKKTQAEVGQLQIGTGSSTNTFTGNINLPGTSRWSSTGNLGIGTTTPGYKLEITGASATNLNGLYIYNSQGTGAAASAGLALGRGPAHIMGQILATNSGDGNFGTGYMSFYTRTWTGSQEVVTEKMRIDGNGNVGIGTAAPGAQLHLADIYAAGGKNLEIGDDTYLTDVDAASTLGVYSVSDPTVGSIKLGSGGGTISGYSGNVGIGTVSPENKLTVAGAVNFTGSLNYNNNEVPCLNNPNGEIGIRWGNGALSNYGIYVSNQETIFAGNYTKLILGWHTGVKIGGYYGYGGIGFYDNAPNIGTAVKRMSIAEGDANVRVTNDLWVGSAGRWMSNTAATSHTQDWSTITGRPGWLNGGSYVSTLSDANSWTSSGFYENGGCGSNWPSCSWYNSLNVRHSNEGNYHGFQIAMNYYNNNLWFRSYQGAGTFQPWVRAVSANSSGSVSISTAGGTSALEVDGTTGTYGVRAIGGTYGVHALSNSYAVYGTGSGWGIYCHATACGGNQAWTNNSDVRLKTNIATISNALTKVLQLRGVYFNWKDPKNGAKTNIGFIAQEALPIVPEVVSLDNITGYYHMQQGPLTALLVEAMKEQQTQISTLSNQLAEMNFDDAGDLNVTVDATGKAEVKTKDGTLISRIGAFAEAVIGKLRVGVLEVKKLVVNGVDIVEKLNKLSATVEQQQKTIDALKKEVEALKK